MPAGGVPGTATMSVGHAPDHPVQAHIGTQGIALVGADELVLVVQDAQAHVLAS